MIVLSVVLKAKEGKEKDLEATLRAMIPAVQQEEGTVEYVLHRAQNNRSQFFFYEKYLDQPSFDYHNSTLHFKELFSLLPSLVDGEPQVELYEDIAAIKR
jgi:quinol monooxygenase YgiN